MFCLNDLKSKKEFIVNKWNLPLDATGSALTHHIVDEVHSVISSGKVVIYPNWGAYYLSGISYFSIQGNNSSLFDAVQNKSIVIEPMDFDPYLSTVTGKEVYKAFGLDLTNFVGYSDFKISYQTPGGDIAINKKELSKINESLFEESTVEYKDIWGLPDGFPVADHTEKIQLAYGLNALKQRLDTIAGLIETEDEAHIKTHEYIVQLFIEKFKQSVSGYLNTLVQKSNDGSFVKENDQKLRTLSLANEAVDKLALVNKYQDLYVKAIETCDALNVKYPLYKDVLDWMVNYNYWHASKKLSDHTNSFKNGIFININYIIYAFGRFIFTTANNGYAGIYSNTINSGARLDYGPFNSANFYGMLFDNGTLYAVADNTTDLGYTGIYSTTDGNTWSIVPTSSSYKRYTRIVKVVDTYILLQYSQSTIERGTTFNSLSSVNLASTGITYVADITTSGTSVIAVGYDSNNIGYILRSSDKGATWSKITTGPTAVNTTLNTVKYYNNRYVAVGLGGGLYVSSDDGLTFQKITTNLPYVITDAFFNGTHWFILSIGVYLKFNSDFTGVPTNIIDPDFGGVVAYDGVNTIYTNSSKLSIDNGVNWVVKNNHNLLAFNNYVQFMPSLVDTEINEVTSVKENLRLKGKISPFNSGTGVCMHVSSSCAFLTEKQVINNAKMCINFKNLSLSLTKSDSVPFTNEKAYLNSVKLNNVISDVYTSRDISLNQNSQLYTKGSINIYTQVSNLPSAIWNHAITTLNDGRVFICGGNNDSSNILNTAYIYNPTTNTYTTVANLPSVMYGHQATTLPDGRVFICGGYNDSSSDLNTAYIYNPTTNTYTTVANLPSAMYYHQITTLPDGRVFICGGYNDSSSDLNTAYIYNPTTNTYTTVTNLPSVGLAGHQATTLPDGRVFICGGLSSSSRLNTAYIYNPTTNTYTSVANLPSIMYYHQATTLPDGRVFICGGYNGSGNYLNTAYIYNPTTNTYTTVANLPIAIWNHAITTLNDGGVFICGGNNNSVLNTAYIYTVNFDMVKIITDQTGFDGFSLFAVLKYTPEKSFTILCHIQGNYYVATHPDAGIAIGIYDTTNLKWIAYKYGPFRPNQDTVVGISYSNKFKHLYFYVPDEEFTPEQKCSVDYFDQGALNTINNYTIETVMPKISSFSLELQSKTVNKRKFKQISIFAKAISVPVFMMLHKKFLYANYAGLNNPNPSIGMARHAIKFYE